MNLKTQPDKATTGHWVKITRTTVREYWEGGAPGRVQRVIDLKDDAVLNAMVENGGKTEFKVEEIQ